MYAGGMVGWEGRVVIYPLYINISSRPKTSSKDTRLRKLRKLCTDVGVRCKQKISFPTRSLAYFAIWSPSTQLRFDIMLVAQINLFYAILLFLDRGVFLLSLFSRQGSLHGPGVPRNNKRTFVDASARHWGQI